MAPDWYRGFMITVIGTVIGVSLILLVIIQRVISTRRRGLPEKTTIFSLPETGIVIKELNPDGMIRAKGETWSGRSVEGGDICEGTKVEVVGNEGFKLLVKPK